MRLEIVSKYTISSNGFLFSHIISVGVYRLNIKLCSGIFASNRNGLMECLLHILHPSDIISKCFSGNVLVSYHVQFGFASSSSGNNIADERFMT